VLQNGQPWVLLGFPVSYRVNEAYKLKLVSQFAFPCKVTV